MLVMDYICEQYQYQQFQQPQGEEPPQEDQEPSIDTELEPLKRLVVINLLYKLYISLSSSTYSERDKLVEIISNVLNLSNMLSYQTLVTILDKIVAYLQSEISSSNVNQIDTGVGNA